MDNIQQTYDDYMALKLKFAESMADMKRHDKGHHEWHAEHGDEPCKDEKECAAMAESYHKAEGVEERSTKEVREVRSSWIVQAEGLAGNQSNATEYPLFGVGGSTRNIDIPEEVDQGTSTETLSSTASVKEAIDYPNPSNDFNVPFFRQISKINDNIPELDLTGKNLVEFSTFKPAAEGEEFLNGPANKNTTKLYEKFLKVRDFYRNRAQDAYHQDKNSDFYQASHLRGHIAHFYDNHQNYMDAIDNWNSLREQFHPFNFGAMPDDDGDQMKSALINVDQAFRELHHHLHTTCARSDQKGGPCGHWGIPRGPSECEYCKYGNPTREIMSMFKRAEKTPEDENWEIATSPFQFQPVEPEVSERSEKAVEKTPEAPAYPEAEGLNYRRPPVSVAPEMVSDIESIPAYDKGWSPVPRAIDAERGMMAYDPAVEPLMHQLKHMSDHLESHSVLFSQAVHATDQHRESVQFFKSLEEAIGPVEQRTPEQHALLEKQDSKIKELESNAHEAQDLMHQHWHSPCPECSFWNNEKDPENCQFCRETPRPLHASVSTTSWR